MAKLHGEKRSIDTRTKFVSSKTTKNIVRKVQNQAEVDTLARERLGFERRLRSQQVQIADLKVNNSLLLEELSLREQQLDLKLAMGDVPACAPWPWKKKRSKGTATAMMLWSDWHVDELITPETTGGMNEWNPGIADKSIKQLVSNTLNLLEIEQRLVDLPRAVLWLGGDFLSGPIHKELEVTNTMSPDGAICWLKPRIKEAIRLLVTEGKFEEFTIVVSFGNHGRWTEKIQFKREWDVSREWWMCHELAQDAKEWLGSDSDRVKWICGKSYQQIVEVEGYRCRFEHGHKNKYSEGIGGPLIPVNRKLGRLNLSGPTRSDWNFMGHFHTAGQLGTVIINSSMIGYAEYGDGRFGYTDPSQTFLVMDEGHGVTLRREVRVR